ncbi:dipeptidyl aminopeptidase 1, putative [Plasmodium gallinaceum]|uniref:dipeptidyl-peptidase I n=1 Tax=Plasmodium gallinaceum TaxID=5849 RepID=A0A1J1GUM8_PLAGA|nr:dipeptidyl aminopeptidase 1, putative [Plasmodium gallinaceum]CRG96215.1 dipeptidyl aminopeptidase 1, putative [Plasmodium gallinaceum]
MTKAQDAIILLLVFLNIIYVKFIIADLPIHAEIRHLIGKWRILKTNTSSTISTCGSSQPNSNLDNIKIKDYKSHLLNINYEFVSELNVILSDNFVLYGDIYDTTNNEHRKNWKILVVYDENNKIIGTWTTIYDEGFEIRIGNETYTALMHYEPSGKCDELSNNDSLDSNGETNCYITNYDKIRFGWLDILHENNERSFGCFYAEKVSYNGEKLNSNKSEHSDENITSDNLERYNNFLENNNEYNEIYSHRFLFNDENELKKEDDYDEEKENHQNPTFSKKKNINYDENTELNWHRVKHHGKKKKINKSLSVHLKQKYACPCSSHEQVHNKKNKGKSFNVVSHSLVEIEYKENLYVSNLLETNETSNELDLKNYENTIYVPKRELEINELPSAFTWGDPYNNNTREYNVLNQLKCGSCYIASLLYVFKRRIEINLTKQFEKEYLNDFDDNLSIQSVLSCSFYDQGCHGGYPFLVSKIAKLQGIPLDKFLPYTAKDQTCPYNVKKSYLDLNKTNNGSGKLKEIKSLFNKNRYTHMNETYDDNLINLDSNKWYAKDYNYVGGCYGCNQCNGEKIMMNEIYKNGPIVASFEATPDFYNYEDGIYYVNEYPHAKRCSVDAKNLNVFNITGWEKVNHAIVIVGWGEEVIDGKKYKYWTARNSWGKNWGKDGYFKVIRGVNFNGIESQTLYIEPDFTRGAGAIILEKMKKELK